MLFDLYARQIFAGEGTPYNAVVYAKPDRSLSRTNQYGELLLARIQGDEIEYALPVQLVYPKLGMGYSGGEIFPNPALMLLKKLAENFAAEEDDDIWTAVPWLVKHSEPEDLEKDLRKVLKDCYDELQQLDVDIEHNNEMWLESAISCLRLTGWTRSDALLFNDVAVLEHPLLKQASEKIATKYWETPNVSWYEWSGKIDFIMESIRNPEIGEIYGY